MKTEKENERKLRKKEEWNNLKTFEKPEDVPNIPIVNKNEYANFYIPRLIKAGAIPKKDLVDGGIYIGEHRRCKISRWNKGKNKFEYIRDKFGMKILDECNHFEDDNGYALFVPIKLTDHQFL